jgi:hypothetical protein
MPRYFLDLPEDDEPRPWDPHAGPRPERPDTRYFGRVFTELEPRLDDRDLDVFLTWDVERLPAYGDNVVAVVLGDEVGKIPRYLERVRAVFKCYGTHPVLGSGPLRDPSMKGLLALAQYGVRWAKWLPGAAAHAPRLVRRRLGRGPALAPVLTIPVGTCNQLDLPLVPIGARPKDLFFAGSLEHQASLRDRIGTAKTRARRECFEAAEALGRRRPGLRLDLRVTHGFDASVAMSAEVYSRALMDAKVCLAPRGTATETWRIFEGLRYGCVVVADRLPNNRYFAGAPILQVDRWSALEPTLARLLDDPDALAGWHVRALAWWDQRCSERALAEFMSEHLNAPWRV